jgi:3-hydroxybutyryl-CoA dehydrogenase
MSKVTVIGGGGAMGHGIALACLTKGHDVTIVSRREETVARGIELVKSGEYGLAAAVKRGKLERSAADGLIEHVDGTTDLEEGVAHADLIFESIDENTRAKHAVLAAAERAAPTHALLATNTSAIMIAELATSLEDPSRLTGTHWFFPANVMRLVEVARSEVASNAAHDGMVDFLVSLGKRPIVVKDSPGFFLTRFVNTWVAEAIRLVELGVAAPAEIDEMVKSGLGWPMGVFELMDGSGGFEAWYHAQEYLRETCGDRYDIPAIADRALEAGYVGDPKVKPGSRGGFAAFCDAPR